MQDNPGDDTSHHASRCHVKGNQPSRVPGDIAIKITQAITRHIVHVYIISKVTHAITVPTDVIFKLTESTRCHVECNAMSKVNVGPKDPSPADVTAWKHSRQAGKHSRPADTNSKACQIGTRVTFNCLGAADVTLKEPGPVEATQASRWIIPSIDGLTYNMYIVYCL